MDEISELASYSSIPLPSPSVAVPGGRCRHDVGGEGVAGLNVARNGSFPFRVATAPPRSSSPLRPP